MIEPLYRLFKLSGVEKVMDPLFPWRLLPGEIIISPPSLPRETPPRRFTDPPDDIPNKPLPPFIRIDPPLPD